MGINSAIVATGQGIGFAIPSSMAKSIIPQLKEKGSVVRGMLGVQIQMVTPELAKSFGLKEPMGALVAEVNPGSPAAKAGLQRGDVIVEFNGTPIKEMHELPRLVAGTPPGKTATLKVLRNGKEQEFYGYRCRIETGDDVSSQGTGRRRIRKILFGDDSPGVDTANSPVISK